MVMHHHDIPICSWMQVHPLWKSCIQHFISSRCYLWNRMFLLVQNIGTLHMFVWLPSLGILYSNAFWVLYLKKHGVTLYLSLFGIPQIPANYPLGLYLKFNFLFLLWSNALLFYMDCHPLFVTLDELILISWQNCFVFNVFQEFLLRSLFTRIPDQLFQSFSWDPWKEFRDFVFEISLAFLWFCYSFLVIFFAEFLMIFLCASKKMFWFSSAFLLTFLCFFLQFLCSSYLILAEFLCSSYAVFKEFIPFLRNFIFLFSEKVWSFKNCTRNA